MMETILNFSFKSLSVLFLSVGLLTCTTSKIIKTEGQSIVAISASSTGFGASGRGINIVLRNQVSGQEIRSSSLSGLSNHSVVQNVPPGSYIVSRVEVPVGNITYSNWSKEVVDFFGVIEISNSSKYYLGNYKGKRGIGLKNILQLSLIDESVPENLKEKIEAVGTGWGTENYNVILPREGSELTVY